MYSFTAMQLSLIIGPMIAHASLVDQFLPGAHHRARIAARQALGFLDDEPGGSVDDASSERFVEGQSDSVQEGPVHVDDREVKTHADFDGGAGGYVGVDVLGIGHGIS